METKFNKVRGTRDILPDEARLYRYIEEKAFEVFRRYNYQELRLPTFENVNLYIRSTGETTDIVEKEMYVFNDKKGRTLALRPEGTPGIVRAYLENNLQEKLPLNKFCYSGQMFRYERPQEGRYREFYQIGCEYFDNSHPIADAEMLLMITELYSELGINNLDIEINCIGCLECRGKYRTELLKFLEDKQEIVCDDCKRRMNKNPLRVLDCKNDRQKFINSGMPSIDKYVCAKCSEHFKNVTAYLTESGITFKINPWLVRGLDYYTQTVFEATANSSDALAAGGRYNNLIKQLGGRDTPAVGFALGLERTADAMKQSVIEIPSLKNIRLFFVVEPKDIVIKQAMNILKSLHNNKIPVAGPYPDKSLKSQMRLADSTKLRHILILGEQELNTNSITIRDMLNKTQELVKQSELIENVLNPRPRGEREG